ncbi:metallochaperone AztD [Thalassospira marina]|uniref:Uncharacterized protein n=1 Tax=Thalassospira marina TaxID=2048283 RepID=A0ABM6QGY2_9PROT|nr:metallochaperone AztD [Thalassospira marina]AUG55856.1 hypothetical protein CSC3H3_23810 [Thalassospira marina]
MRPGLTGLAAGLMSISALSFAEPAFASDETRESWRLFVTDQTKAEVSVINPDSGTVENTFPTTGYVTHLVASDSGKTLFAVQMDHDMVNVISSGITLSSHGDHSDLKVTDAALLPAQLDGQRPVHAVPHGDKIIQFYDQQGEGHVFSERGLLDGKVDYQTVKTAAPHHGVVVPMGDYFVVSEPNLATPVKEGELPPRKGAKVIDHNGQQVGDIATCTGLHGEAYSAGLVAFGCEEGVLIAEANHGDAPQLHLLPYGDDMPEGKVGHLAGGKAMQFFLGDYGADKLVVIDPSSDKPFSVVELPVRHVHFILDPVRVKIAYVFTEDGKLHALDVLSGKIIQSTRVTEPYSKDGHWRDPRPRLAVMNDTIAITDPKNGLIRLLDAESFKERKTIKTGGLPFNIVAIGGSGLVH